MNPTRHIWRSALIGLSVAFVCTTAFALDSDRTIFQFQHTSWTAKEGAPNAVHALAQTTDGYLWAGGPTGLYRFDGIRFEHYRPPSGQELRSDYVLTLMATPDGGLWIGFSSGGADFLKGGRITSYGEPDGFPLGLENLWHVEGFKEVESTKTQPKPCGLGTIQNTFWTRME